MRNIQKSINILVLFFGPILISDSAAWSVSDLDTYSSQRACAQKCYYDRDFAGGYYTNRIASVLRCDTPCQDSCCCRSDLQSVAESYLSSCVSSLCDRNTIDILNAVSVYVGYCTPKYMPPTTTQAQATSQQSSPGSNSPQFTASRTSSITHDPSGSGVQYPPQGSGSGLSRSDKISLGVGIPSALCLLGVLVGCARWIGRRYRD